jgi:hypothetical protein
LAGNTAKVRNYKSILMNRHLDSDILSLPPDLSVIAQVQVNPAVLEDPNVGAQILANPRIIFEALADSLELGVLITIAVGTPTDKSAVHSRYGAPEIVLLSTDQYGRTQGQRLL